MSLPKAQPREHAEHISKKKEKPHHIGKKTSAVFQQEYFSLVNVKESFRDHNWTQKFKVLKEEILKLKDGEAIYLSFRNKYQNVGRLPP